jgi:hypothetical protein
MPKHLLVCAIMVKNEEERIIRTIASCQSIVNKYIILDTGSTDNTVNVITKYCELNNIQLKLCYKPFVDFSKNRNYLIDECYNESEYILFLDSNDEVKQPELIKKFLISRLKYKTEALFSLRYEWINDLGVKDNNYTYSKTGIIRNNNPSIRYIYPVHEVIICSDKKYTNNNNCQNLDCYIFQDRLLDKPSSERFIKDKEILLNYISNINKNDSRSYLYLGQTYECLYEYDNAYLVYEELLKLEQKNIHNYNFYLYKANYKIGCINGIKSNPLFTKYLLKAYNITSKFFEHCEPFYQLAVFNYKINNIKMAKLYIDKCCLIKMITNDSVTIEQNIYDVKRWELLEKINKIIDNNNIEINHDNNYKLNVLIPCRNMETQINKFIPHINAYLSKIGITNFEIFIIEQDNDQLFNRGALFNVGYKETMMSHNNQLNYYCLHDIDILPNMDTINNYYMIPDNTIRHLYGHLSSLDGIFLLSQNTYQLLNGFSNNYPGWGFEDNDFLRRGQMNNVSIDRAYFQERFKTINFKEMDEKTNDLKYKMELPQTAVNKNTFEEFTKNPYLMFENGLNNLEYTINSKIKYDNYTHIKCCNFINKKVYFVSFINGADKYVHYLKNIFDYNKINIAICNTVNIKTNIIITVESDKIIIKTIENNNMETKLIIDTINKNNDSLYIPEDDIINCKISVDKTYFCTCPSDISNELLLKLNKYKLIEKNENIDKYKFVITDKLIYSTISIYLNNNNKLIVGINEYDNIDEGIEYIKMLDQNDTSYLEMVHKINMLYLINKIK